MGEARVLAHTCIWATRTRMGSPYAYGYPIRIWAASTRMGCPYAYGAAHTRMGRIPVWDGTWILTLRRDVHRLEDSRIMVLHYVYPVELSTGVCFISIISIVLICGKTKDKTSDFQSHAMTSFACPSHIFHIFLADIKSSYWCVKSSYILWIWHLWLFEYKLVEYWSFA